jgi:hypothetical protein
MSWREQGGELASYKEGLNLWIKEDSLSYSLLSLSGWLERHGRKWIPPGANIFSTPHAYRDKRLSLSYSKCTKNKKAGA